jgi:hypothetical protein
MFRTGHHKELRGIKYKTRKTQHLSSLSLTYHAFYELRKLGLF